MWLFVRLLGCGVVRYMNSTSGCLGKNKSVIGCVQLHHYARVGGDGGVGEWKCLVILAAGTLAMLCVGS